MSFGPRRTKDLQANQNFQDIAKELDRQRVSFSGAGPPIVTEPGSLWYDTDNDVLKYYDNARSAQQLSIATGTVSSLTEGTGINLTPDTITTTGSIAIDSTVATLTGTQTLTNKTLTSPAITTPTGIVKGDVGLGNVDNTSDANKPVSTATQTALDGKVDENAAITGATKTKITYDAKGLVTAGADLASGDLPSHNHAAGDITSGTIAQARLGTGSAGAGSKFLADDQTYKTISSGGLSDGDYGDITVGGTGTTMTIDNDAVTYAKMQDVSATDRLLGRDTAGAGNVEEIAPADVRSMLGLVIGTNVQAWDSDLDEIASDGYIPWTDFTPSWTNLTVGNGTNIGRYCQIGKTVFVKVMVTFGTTSSMSTGPRFALPVAPVTTFLVTDYSAFAGTAWSKDTSASAVFMGVPVYESTGGSNCKINAVASDLTNAGLRNYSSTIPMTWANTDIIGASFLYEVA